MTGPGPLLRRLRAGDSGFAERWAALCRRGARGAAPDLELETAVRAILDDVRARGDAAVREHTERLDRRSPDPATGSYQVSAERWEAAADQVAPEVAAALRRASERIAAFHQPQRPGSYDIEGGRLALRAVPLGRVGLYAPGGTARYPSSVLMTAVPARLAGVDEIILCTPGASPETLLAARLAGVDRVFELGGAQAIAALAYGTDTVPRVDKIVGPGNQWVATAKRLVYGAVDIDSVAGPSEVMIVADRTAAPRFIAADLLAQAEHDREAHPILVVTDEAVADAVEDQLTRQLADLPRAAIARAALERHGACLVVGSSDEALVRAEEFAPEHLELAVADAAQLAGRVRRAGAVFVGEFSPEAAGDYLAGPNHVLPTGGCARYASPLGVYDFVKRVSVLRLGRAELAAQRGDIAQLARVEGLEGHARSVEVRFAASSGAAGDGGGGSRAPTPDPAPISHPLDLVRPELLATSAYQVPHPGGITVKLDANELPFALPDAVAAELARELTRVPLHRYPDPGQARLRARVAADLGLSPDQLLFGNGSDEIILLLAACFARPRPGRARAALAYPTPTFALFRGAALAVGAEPIEIPLDPEADFALDRAAVERCLEAHRPNLVFFARPNNPTGTLWPGQLVVELARAYPDILMVSDEAYSAYAGDSLVGQLDGTPNLLVMQTLSKIGMAALRVGYLAGAPELVSEVDKVRGPYNLGSLNQRAALWLLENQRALLDQRCAQVVSERDRVARELGAMPALHPFSSRANLLLVRVGRPGDGRATTVWRELCARGVLVRNFDGAGGPLEGCLRITIGTPDENDQLLTALAQALATG